MDNRVFMDFMDDDFFREKEIDLNDFISDLGNIKEMSAFDILDKISSLKIEDRRQVFANDMIKSVLREGLLFESASNQWHYYRKILSKITPEEFLSLYNINFLKNYFANNNYGNISTFFAALCERDVNNVVDYVLKDDEMFKEFFKLSYTFCSLFSELNYGVFKKVIFKMQENNLEISYDFLSNVESEYQRWIIYEPGITDDTLVSLLMRFRNKFKSEFFENDPRALYLYTRFNINDLAKSGIKFNDNILKKKDFFDMLKKDSFIEFRNNINNMEKYNNPVIIESRLEDYYDELINLYDKDSGLFKEYEEVLNNPKMYEFKNSYIFDFGVVSKISSHLMKDDSGSFYYEKKDRLLDFLEEETSKKLSEIIIDAIFRDNIYNVWLNIWEMLRYNNLLDECDKIFDSDQIDFYMMILNFDKISNFDKIELYYKLKNINYNLIFYEDLRRVKDIAYNRIKNNLMNPSLHHEYIDKESTEKYGVTVYDLKDREYTLLVRTQAEFKDEGRYRRSCYSIVSSDNTQVFGENDMYSFLYGYNSFENDMVLHMFESDSYSLNFRDEPSRYVNRIMSSEQLVKASSGYSEVQLVNPKSDKGKYKWTAKKPDFIVVFEIIRDMHIKESRRLGIPIVVIRNKKLDKEDVINVNCDKYLDRYVNDLYSEKEHRIRR